ncbi:hemolysin XhlA [Desulfosporosinus fructosivorans]|uniref:Hemolysin XhlA n=1 Tax=Desulfosporosinus fructosivorans TaxID=2018669 RepID=A0A4Z0R607_9FIRM|nr:hemolysin XhlA family protein [Desulfosporosinus fructosivorans]TGE37086.1 hemolysin XhlA [Desulfosporosinus fructosivorans]
MAEQQDVLMDIRERLVRVETKLDNHNGIRERLDTVEDRAIENESRSKSNCHRIDKLEENNTWLWRTVVGAIIAAAIGALAIFR